MNSRSRWARSRARSIPASRALGNSGSLPRAISIRRSTAGSRCSAPAASAARRPRAICCRAVSPRSTISRAESSDIWKACRKRKAAGAANVSSSTTASRSAMAWANARWKKTAMSEGKALSERIDALEAKAMFQDETIEALNKTITEQWLKIDVLTRQLAALSERLQHGEARVFNRTLPGCRDAAPGGQRAAAALQAACRFQLPRLSKHRQRLVPERGA